MKYLHDYINSIENKNLRDAVKEINSYDIFFKWPASTGIHHGYAGGLVAHTEEVLGYALKGAEAHSNVNLDVLIAAAVWHDLAKIWDYKLDVFFSDQYNEIPKKHVLEGDYGHHKKVWTENTDYKNKIHHVTGSTAEFTFHAKTHGVDGRTLNNIQHCIIAHHNKKEWGSIREPQTIEAWLLHSADYQSARWGPRKEK